MKKKKIEVLINVELAKSLDLNSVFSGTIPEIKNKFNDVILALKNESSKMDSKLKELLNE